MTTEENNQLQNVTSVVGINLNIARPINYKINIKKTEGNKYELDYTEYFDKNDKLHVEAMKNSVKVLEIIRKNQKIFSSISVNEKEFSVNIKIILPFESIADFIASEFIMFGSAGKITLIELFRLTAKMEIYHKQE